MPSTPTSLWDGYDDRSERDLIDLLNRKIEAAKDPDDPSVDEKAARDFAQAIASHEWLKRDRTGEHHAELYAHAKLVATKDVGSWRPK
jgi:hypothetical protein